MVLRVVRMVIERAALASLQMKLFMRPRQQHENALSMFNVLPRLPLS